MKIWREKEKRRKIERIGGKEKVLLAFDVMAKFSLQKVNFDESTFWLVDLSADRGILLLSLQKIGKKTSI